MSPCQACGGVSGGGRGAGCAALIRMYWRQALCRTGGMVGPCHTDCEAANSSIVVQPAVAPGGPTTGQPCLALPTLHFWAPALRHVLADSTGYHVPADSADTIPNPTHPRPLSHTQPSMVVFHRKHLVPRR